MVETTERWKGLVKQIGSGVPTIITGYRTRWGDDQYS